MSSHFDCLGLNGDDDRAFDETLRAAWDPAEAVWAADDDSLALYRWQDGDGGQLWYELEQEELANVTPAWASALVHSFGLERLDRGEANEWLAHGWLNPRETGDDGDVPLVVEIVNGPAVADLAGVVSLSLTAFAEEVQLCADEDEFKALFQEKLGKDAAISEESLFPDWDKQPRAQINGRVISARRCRCSLSGRDYYHCQLASYGGHFDAVYASADLPRLPQPGEIISGDYWLVGTLQPPLG